MAILAAVGFVLVRRRLHRLERSDDVASAEARKRHEAERRKRRREGVE
jgi:hypothetical protein